MNRTVDTSTNNKGYRLLALFLVLGGYLTQAGDAPVSVADIVEEVAPSVVYIESETGAGSGFVVSTEPFLDVLTNHHVMGDERHFSVYFFLPTGNADETRKVEIEDARAFFAFPRLDFGFIRMNNADPRVAEVKAAVKPIPSGDSRGIRVGERVVVIGSPGAGLTVLGNSVSDGILSGKNRHIKGLPYFQTTAPVNPGNSGGPLLNIRGEVIGIVTAKNPFADNIAFALPIYMTNQKYYDFYMPEKAAGAAVELLAEGTRHLDAKRYDQARAAFAKAAEASPGRAKPLIRQADAAVRDGDHTAAMRLYEDALQVEGIRYDDLMFCILDLGRLYGHKGDHAKAIEVFNRGLERDPTHADLNRNIGVAYASIWRRQRALAHWMISLWVEPDQPQLRQDMERLSRTRRR